MPMISQSRSPIRHAENPADPRQAASRLTPVDVNESVAVMACVERLLVKGVLDATVRLADEVSCPVGMSLNDLWLTMH